VLSRTLVIVLAAGVSLYRATQGAWVESGGLAALAAGLILLRLAVKRPALKPAAWIAFGVTALSMIVVALRSRGRL
jgi:hypothetical protein